MVNSSAPGKCGIDFQIVIFKLMYQIELLGVSCEIALRWKPQNFIDVMLC